MKNLRKLALIFLSLNSFISFNLNCALDNSNQDNLNIKQNKIIYPAKSQWNFVERNLNKFKPKWNNKFFKASLATCALIHIWGIRSKSQGRISPDTVIFINFLTTISLPMIVLYNYIFVSELALKKNRENILKKWATNKNNFPKDTHLMLQKYYNMIQSIENEINSIKKLSLISRIAQDIRLSKLIHSKLYCKALIFNYLKSYAKNYKSIKDLVKT